jgi:hypothetical protein
MEELKLQTSKFQLLAQEFRKLVKIEEKGIKRPSLGESKGN